CILANRPKIRWQPVAEIDEPFICHLRERSLQSYRTAGESVHPAVNVNRPRLFKRGVSLKPPATKPSDEPLLEQSFPSFPAGLARDPCRPAAQASQRSQRRRPTISGRFLLLEDGYPIAPRRHRSV